MVRLCESMVIVGYSWQVLGDIRQVLGDDDHMSIKGNEESTRYS